MTHSGCFTEYNFELFLCILLLSSCSPYPPADNYEVDGLISIDGTRVNESVNWKEIHYLNSIGMVSHIQDPDSSFSLNYSFYLTNPGSYSLWMLTTGSTLSDDSAKPDITVTGPDGFLIDRFQADPPFDARLKWINLTSENQNTGLLNLAESGEYQIQINSGGSDGFQVHKIHLAYNDYLKPTGLGLPASITPEINAADLFREQPVMLPPDWTFGLIAGSVRQDDQLTSYPAAEIDWPIIPDAYWSYIYSDAHAESLLSHTERNDIVAGFEISDPDQVPSLYEMGYQFSFSKDEVTQNRTEEIFSIQYEAFPQHERGIFFRDIHHAYNPLSKQYPAMMTQPVQTEWSSEATINDNTFNPGGLHEMVETFANPEFSTYNIPFLSIPIFFEDILTSDVDHSDELLTRTLQLSAFMPVMHILHHGKFSERLNDEQLKILSRYADLRSKLFPYIYTHAHITRQTGQSIIGGFRDHDTQFRFGDAFLVAPITEPDQLERSVYFPGEGSWYDYDTGRRYSSGQSWIVEAPLNRIPLFVKAGSVIPYRVEGGQIRQGTNDHLRVEIYTGDAGTFRLTEDDGVSRDYRRALAARTMFRYNEVAGRLRLTIGAVQSHFEGMNDTRTYQLLFKHTDPPQEVLVDDELISEKNEEASRYWSYDEESATLIIDLKDQSKHDRIEISITP